jgi:hypothetical protein
VPFAPRGLLDARRVLVDAGLAVLDHVDQEVAPILVVSDRAVLGIERRRVAHVISIQMEVMVKEHAHERALPLVSLTVIRRTNKSSWKSTQSASLSSMPSVACVKVTSETRVEGP